ncbi:Fpg/Nei family DNA glycosylase [Streptomyces sp. NPDC050560]|uniref:Fpg/Nei family DNA glycosylase n=1 Tax=Streptomyces sp. NPDC050560 TaxID=3365630 RepID=UPI0037AFC63E
MPEGDTVWQTARRLHRALGGRTLIRCELRVPRFATADLTGRTVLEVAARGKHLLTRFEGDITLHTHLRMDGAWWVYPDEERWRGGPGHQIRAVLSVPGETAVGYRLPVLELLRTGDEERAVGHLGPDLLGPDWDPDAALANLRGDPARPLGEALLDQRNLAGIGNVYKSELCFLLHATPWTPVGQLPEETLHRLPGLARKLLEANRDRIARTTTGRRDQRLYVYGRAPKPCLRCGTPVQLGDQGDGARERPTYWCPVCQPGPAPRPRTAVRPDPTGRATRRGTAGAPGAARPRRAP